MGENCSCGTCKCKEVIKKDNLEIFKEWIIEEHEVVYFSYYDILLKISKIQKENE